jgi:hypothetical protein
LGRCPLELMSTWHLQTPQQKYKLLGEAGPWLEARSILEKRLISRNEPQQLAVF